MGVLTGQVGDSAHTELNALVRLSYGCLRFGCEVPTSAVTAGAAFVRVGYAREPKNAGRVLKSHGDLYAINGHAWKKSGSGRVAVEGTDLMELLTGDISAMLRPIGGEFAAVAWSAEQKRLVLVGDPLGVVRAYWSRLPNGEFVFSTAAIAVARHPLVSKSLNRESVALALCGLPIAPNATHFSQVHALPPGHFLEFMDGDVCIHPYFQVCPAHDDDRPLNEIVSDYRDRFVSSIRWQSHLTPHSGVALSGGLDSSSILRGLAAVVDNPSHLIAASVNVPGAPACDEQEYATAAVIGTGVSHVTVDATWDIEWDPIFATADAPNTVLWVPFIANAVNVLRAHRLERALVGCMGDLVGGMDFATVATLFSKRAFWQLMHVFTCPARRWLPFAVRSAARAMVVNAAWQTPVGRSWLISKAESDGAKLGVGVPPWISEKTICEFGLRERWRAALTLRHRAITESSCRFAELLPSAHAELGVASHCARLMGMHLGAPFADRELVELSARLPISARRARGVTRIVHRQAMRGILPEVNRLRTTKTTFLPYFSKIWGQWSNLDLSGLANASDWIDLSRLACLDAEYARGNWAHRLADLRVFSAWLLRQDS